MRLERDANRCVGGLGEGEREDVVLRHRGCGRRSASGAHTEGGDALAAAEDVLAPEGAVLARGGSFHPAHSPSARITRDTTANNTARNTSDLESNDERS